MKIKLISFTKTAGDLAGLCAHELCCLGEEAESFRKKEMEMSLSEWTEAAFKEADAIIFVGACGIAVRAIAPFVKDKFTDPAVVVMDEKANFVISLLSGHVGGANALALKLSAITGAVPVVTTATDVNGKFAVDVFAKKNHLKIGSRRLAKLVSAEILEQKKIPLFIRNGISFPEDKVPDELELVTENEFKEKNGIKIAVSERALQDNFPDNTLYLIPADVFVGMGCKKEKEAEVVAEKFSEILKEYGIFPEAVTAIASIDIKKEEQGLISLAESLGVPFVCFDAATLLETPGEFSTSSFVRQTVGVDCVCERSAVCASGGGKILIRKQAGSGVTLAAAVKNINITFD